MFGLIKKLGGWAVKTLKREAKGELLKKVVPMQDIGIPRIKKRGQ
jgi:hypothetical protein